VGNDQVDSCARATRTPAAGFIRRQDTVEGLRVELVLFGARCMRAVGVHMVIPYSPSGKEILN